MVNFICCTCSLRTSVMIIAVISTMHSMAESAAIYYVGDHRLMVSSATPVFYTVATTQGLMIVTSIILFVGAYMRLIWLCLPWLIMTVLNVLYHFYILITFVMSSFSNFDGTKLEMAILLTFSAVVLSYMAYVVYSFIQHVRGSGSMAGARDEEDSYPLMK